MYLVGSIHQLNIQPSLAWMLLKVICIGKSRLKIMLLYPIGNVAIVINRVICNYARNQRQCVYM